MRYSEIVEDSSVDTVTLWHGGNRLESDYLEFPSHRKGSWEYGPGLYLINNQSVARKYAKGSNVLYKVTVKLERNIDDVRLPMEAVEDFITRFVKTKSRPEFRSYVSKRLERQGLDALPAETLITLALNLESVQSSKTGAFRRWLKDHGVGYVEVKNYGGWGDDGLLYVIVDPTLIKKVERAS